MRCSARTDNSLPPRGPKGRVQAASEKETGVQLLTGLSTGFALLALAVSITAVRTALRAYRWRSEPRRKITDMELEIAELTHEQEAIRASFKRLNARVGMRDARAKLAEQTQEAEESLPASGGMDLQQKPGETTEQWKRRVRPVVRNIHGR